MLNWVRRKRGLPYWCLAAHLKKKVKNAVQFISSFEDVVAHAAHERGADGVVCGHIHSAEIRQIGVMLPDTGVLILRAKEKGRHFCRPFEVRTVRMVQKATLSAVSLATPKMVRRSPPPKSMYIPALP